jgi:Domain of unknown function (DUF927)
MSARKNRKARNSKRRGRAQSRKRDHVKRRNPWSVRRYRVGTPTGPAFVEFKFPTEGGGFSRLCVPNRDLRLMKTLLDEFADYLPIFPSDVPSTEAGQKQFIRGLVSSGSAPLELAPTGTGFIDQNTFVTHGEIIRADGTRVPRPRLEELNSPAFADVRGTPGGARQSVLKLARHSTYLAFAIGVELAACLPTYLKLRTDQKGERTLLVPETAVFNFSGKSSSGKSSACLATISLAGSPDRAGSLDLSRRGLAETASDSNDLAFVLDDTEKGEDGPGAFVKTLKGVVHVVPGGRSKIISRGVDQARFPQLRWSAFALTSSPQPIRKLAAENRWLMSPGDKVRLFDIRVPGPEKGGIFDRIKGHNSQRAQRSIKLIAKLQGGYINHHGHTIPQWVQYLMAADRSKRILQRVDEFLDHVKARGNGWEVRFAIKFGLVYAAMQMATDAGLLPWPPILALKVASKCYRKARATARGHAERVDGAATKLLRLMTQSGGIVDQRTDGAPTKITDRAIAIRYTKHNRTKLGILDRALLKVLGTKRAKEAFAKMLKDAGLVKSGHGHAGTRQVRITTVHNGTLSERTRLWVVDAAKFKRFAEQRGNS